PEFFVDIDADFSRAAICAAWQEFFEVQPANHAAVGFRHPDWILVRRMFAEPGQTRFDRGWLKLGRYHARRHSGIVNVDDSREIGFERGADEQFSRHELARIKQKQFVSSWRNWCVRYLSGDNLEECIFESRLKLP